MLEKVFTMRRPKNAPNTAFVFSHQLFLTSVLLANARPLDSDSRWPLTHQSAQVVHQFPIVKEFSLS